MTVKTMQAPTMMPQKPFEWDNLQKQYLATLTGTYLISTF